jgi:signal transduction histidine kinase
MLYAGAAAFSAWAGRRPLAQSGLARLVLVCVVLAISTAADGLALLTSGRVAQTLGHVAEATALPVPLLFVEFFRARHPKRLIRDAAFWAELTLVAATAAGALVAAVSAPAWSSRLSLAGELVLAVSVLVTVQRIGRIAKRDRALGPSAFVGGLLLAVFAVYDAIVGLSHVDVRFVHLGFAFFAVAFFAGQIARIELLREDLMKEKESLRAKSDRVTGAFRDLRVRQDELVRKEQLAAVGELAAVIAHEVRNPLAIIKNAVSSLRRRPEDASQTATLCAILDEESTRLNRIVGDLLHYAKPVSVTLQNVDVVDVVERAVSLIREEPRVELDLEVERGLPPIIGDAVLVRQAIDNVLHNAVQAMGSGGSITVGVRGRRSTPDGVEVTIRDTGEGMDTVVRRRALDPFFTTRPTGTGLGLAVVARVVEAHGGQLTILSERGAGTEVRIFLPRSSEESEPRVRRRMLPTIEPFRSSSRPDAEEPPSSRPTGESPPSAP